MSAGATVRGRVAGLAAIALLGCGDALPGEEASLDSTSGALEGVAEGVRVSDAVVASLGGDNPGALYFTRSDGGSTPDTVVAVETAMSESAELHRSLEQGGLQRMEPVAALELPAASEVRLAPGGYHVMLIGLRKELVPGDTIDATVVFRRAGRLLVRARVVSYFELADDLGEGMASGHAGH